MKLLVLSILIFLHGLLWAQSVENAGDKIDSLIQAGRSFCDQRDYANASDDNEQAEKLASENYGAESLYYIKTCIGHGRISLSQRDYEESKKWYLNAKDWFEKDSRLKDTNYADCLAGLGQIDADMGRYEDAELLLSESMTMRKNLLGVQHDDYKVSRRLLAGLYVNMRNFMKAEILYNEMNEEYLSLGDTTSMYYAGTMNSLAGIYANTKRPELAISSYTKVNSICKKVVGSASPYYAGGLQNLALIYTNLWQYERAEELLLEAKSIFENEMRDIEHPFYLNVLNNLAVLYLQKGEHSKAEPIFLSVKNTRGIKQGKQHPDYAQSLFVLADLYVQMGFFKKAETMYIESNKILEASFGEKSLDIASGYRRLASCYERMREFEKMELVIFKAIPIYEALYEKDDPTLALTMNDFGLCYLSAGKLNEAEKYLLKATTMMEALNDRSNAGWPICESNLARVYHRMGRFDKAEELYLRSNAAYEKIWGKDFPYFVNTSTDLAKMYLELDRFADAGNIFSEVAKLDRKRMLSALNHLSEEELNGYLLTFIDRQYSMLSLNHSSKGVADISETCYDNVLFYKGFLLNAHAQRNQLIKSDPEAMKRFNLLRACERQLETEYTKPIANREEVEKLEEVSNTLEKEIAVHAKGSGELIKQVVWQDIQKKLKAEEAAVEFVQYAFKNPDNTYSIKYAAMLIRQGYTRPEFIYLFDEESLDSLMTLNSERKSDYVNGLYSLVSRGLTAAEKKSKSLYDIIWNPLVKSLEGVKTIYFSPIGLLYRLDLGAIPITELECLSDKYNLIQLNSTRQLVMDKPVNDIRSGAVLFGGIEYDPDSTLFVEEAIFASRASGDISFMKPDTIFGTESWSELPGTAREVDALKLIMERSGINVELLKEKIATEESFKELGAGDKISPRIIHVASHGYFFPDPKNDNIGMKKSSDNEPVFKMSEHPMLRSGLIMAGGNAAWQGARNNGVREDGILTAFEISHMDLSGTELVVMSACETGLGDIQGNEGVYGLQRAFKIAGAKYIIMSLWQVPDKQTSMLMTTFYKKWLEEKMTIHDAFHAAQKELRDMGFDPYQWAGFVLVE